MKQAAFRLITGCVESQDQGGIASGLGQCTYWAVRFVELMLTASRTTGIFDLDGLAV